MLVSRKLLSRYVDISGITTQEIADALTNAGIEVEGVDTLIKGTNLVVGHVLECVDHPDSDHLHITKVDLGTHVEQIVCGAANIAQGQYVVVAKVGAVLPDITIKDTIIRGVESKGMICSLNELGIAEKYQTEEQKTGIVTLSPNEPGSDAAIALGLDDEIMDVSQTPNRSDFLSITSIAHEVSALFNRPLTIDESKDSAYGDKTQLKVTSHTDKSPYFAAKVVNSVTIKPSSGWIKEVLIASGIKPVNNVVDISNLVMLETGQPLHFYDRSFLSNLDLSVRDDIEGSFKALDDREYQLQNGDLVIMNADTPVGIAGIMGLGNSMIQNDTKGIVIEVARFNNVSVRKTASRLGIFSDSSARFTKPMDPKSAQKAMDRAVELLVQEANAQGLEETVVYGELPWEAKPVSINLKRINEYLGTSFTHEEVMPVFERLYFNPQVEGDVITCTAPSFRRDIEIDVDLIEEVIRVIGYDALPSTLPNLDLTLGNLNQFQRSVRLIEDTLLGLGADQANTYTLVEEAHTTGMMALENPVSLMSPMSDKRAFLRTHLFPSMLETLSYNNAHKNHDVLLFEHSRIYASDKTTNRLAIIGQGNVIKQNWTKVSIPVDFYTIKGMIMTVLDRLGIGAKRIGFKTEGFDTTALHPFKSATITLDRQEIGVIGHIHPTLASKQGLKDAVYCEIDLDILFSKKSGAVKSTVIAKYPEMKRDLSVLVALDVSVQSIIQVIEKASKRYLVDLNVYDVFTSEKLGNHKSITFQLTFGQNRTLEVEEINTIMNDITESLTKQLNIEVR